MSNDLSEGRKTGWFWADNRIFDIGLKPNVLIVYVYLLRCEREGRCFPSFANIAKKCGISTRTAKYAIPQLVKAKLIRASSGGKGVCNVYTILGLGGAGDALVQEMHQLTSAGGAQGGAGDAQGVVQEMHPNKTKLTILNNKTKETELPEWLDSALWNDWQVSRKSVGKLTPRALELQLSKLTKLRDQGHDPVEMIETAIESGWKTFYAPKGGKTKPKYSFLEGET